jgi:hypothetical protein
MKKLFPVLGITLFYFAASSSATGFATKDSSFIDNVVIHKTVTVIEEQGEIKNSMPVIRYVDPLIGTGPARTVSALRHSESGSEDKGQTFPAVGRPFGMTQWTPETRTTENKCVSPYYYSDSRITGFRGSHWMSGSCTQCYSHAFHNY